MIYHIVTGDLAAVPLKTAIDLEPAAQDKVVVMKDVLSVGPIQKQDDRKFSDLRSAFWQQIVHEKNIVHVDDQERLLNTGNELSKNENARILIWIAPLPADICTYLWSIQFLKKYAHRIYIVNIAGLPFLDEDGKIFFPKSIGDLPPKEIVKAYRLARLPTNTELETDFEEWDRLTNENAIIRVHEGGKKITSKPENYYDNQLLGFCSHQYQKASKIVGQAISKFNIPTGDLVLGWRLRQMYDSGRLLILGDPTAKLKDYEVKLPGEDQQLELGI